MSCWHKERILSPCEWIMPFKQSEVRWEDRLWLNSEEFQYLVVEQGMMKQQRYREDNAKLKRILKIRYYIVTETKRIQTSQPHASNICTYCKHKSSKKDTFLRILPVMNQMRPIKSFLFFKIEVIISSYILDHDDHQLGQHMQDRLCKLLIVTHI